MKPNTPKADIRIIHSGCLSFSTPLHERLVEKQEVAGQTVVDLNMPLQL